MAKSDNNYLVIKSCMINGSRVEVGDIIELDIDTFNSISGYNRVQKTDKPVKRESKVKEQKPQMTARDVLPGSNDE